MSRLRPFTYDLRLNSVYSASSDSNCKEDADDDKESDMFSIEKFSVENEVSACCIFEFVN